MTAQKVTKRLLVDSDLCYHDMGEPLYQSHVCLLRHDSSG